MSKLLKAAFIDRDGVINKDKHYLYKISDFEFTDHCVAALRNVNDAGYCIIIVTNQSGIGRGYYTEADYHKLTSWYVNELKIQQVVITAVFFCPHHPRASLFRYRKQCHCRKPKPGMILAAARQYDIDLSMSVLIGDKITDIQAGEAAGVRNNILINNQHSLVDPQQLVSAQQIVNPQQKISCYGNLYEWSLSLQSESISRERN